MDTHAPPTVVSTPRLDRDTTEQSSRDGTRIYNTLTTGEKQVFSRGILRWASKALVGRAFISWCQFSKFKEHLASQEQHAKEHKQAIEILSSNPPGSRSKSSLKALVAWGTQAKSLKDISKKQLEGLFQQVVLVEVQHGEPLFFQGQRPDAYWVVLLGQLKLFVAHAHDANAQDVLALYAPAGQSASLSSIRGTNFLDGRLGREIGTCRSGDGIGEISFLGGVGSSGRACSAVAASTLVHLIKVPKLLYKQFLQAGHISSMNMKTRVDFVLSIAGFSHWRREDATRIAYVLKEKVFPRKTKFVHAGHAVDTVYMVTKGVVKLLHPKGNVGVALLGDKDMIGLEALAHSMAASLRFSQSGRSRPGAGDARKLERTSEFANDKSWFHAECVGEVHVYYIALKDLIKFCVGGHGARTCKVLNRLLDVQFKSRREHFSSVRQLQRQRASGVLGPGHADQPKSVQIILDHLCQLQAHDLDSWSSYSSDDDESTLLSWASSRQESKVASLSSGTRTRASKHDAGRRHVGAGTGATGAHVAVEARAPLHRPLVPAHAAGPCKARPASSRRFRSHQHKLAPIPSSALDWQARGGRLLCTTPTSTLPQLLQGARPRREPFIKPRLEAPLVLSFPEEVPRAREERSLGPLGRHREEATSDEQRPDIQGLRMKLQASEQQIKQSIQLSEAYKNKVQEAALLRHMPGGVGAAF